MYVYLVELYFNIQNDLSIQTSGRNESLQPSSVFGHLLCRANRGKHVMIPFPGISQLEVSRRPPELSRILHDRRFRTSSPLRHPLNLTSISS
jgi:hypothetical protein